MRQQALNYLNEKAEATTENGRQSVKKLEAQMISVSNSSSGVRIFNTPITGIHTLLDYHLGTGTIYTTIYC